MRPVVVDEYRLPARRHQSQHRTRDPDLHIIRHLVQEKEARDDIRTLFIRVGRIGTRDVRVRQVGQLAAGQIDLQRRDVADFELPLCSRAAPQRQPPTARGASRRRRRAALPPCSS